MATHYGGHQVALVKYGVAFRLGLGLEDFAKRSVHEDLVHDLVVAPVAGKG